MFPNIVFHCQHGVFHSRCISLGLHNIAKRIFSTISGCFLDKSIITILQFFYMHKIYDILTVCSSDCSLFMRIIWGKFLPRHGAFAAACESHLLSFMELQFHSLLLSEALISVTLVGIFSSLDVTCISNKSDWICSFCLYFKIMDRLWRCLLNWCKR